MTEIQNPKGRLAKAIVAEEVTLVTPTNQAIYEAGKSMLIESVSTGREFCKFMIGTATSAIPIYLKRQRILRSSAAAEMNLPTLQLCCKVIYGLTIWQSLCLSDTVSHGAVCKV